MSDCPRFVSFNSSRLYHLIDDVEGVLDHDGKGVTVLFRGGDSEVVLGWDKTAVMNKLNGGGPVVQIDSRSSSSEGSDEAADGGDA